MWLPSTRPILSGQLNLLLRFFEKNTVNALFSNSALVLFECRQIQRGVNMNAGKRRVRFFQTRVRFFFCSKVQKCIHVHASKELVFSWTVTNVKFHDMKKKLQFTRILAVFKASFFKNSNCGFYYSCR